MQSDTSECRNSCHLLFSKQSFQDSNKSHNDKASYSCKSSILHISSIYSVIQVYKNLVNSVRIYESYPRGVGQHSSNVVRIPKVSGILSISQSCPRGLGQSPKKAENSIFSHSMAYVLTLINVQNSDFRVLSKSIYFSKIIHSRSLQSSREQNVFYPI